MNVRVKDIMQKQVVTIRPNATIDRVRRILNNNSFGAIPVINNDGKPVGIVSTTDLVDELKGSSPVSSVMTRHVHTVTSYSNVSTAATLMRKNGIHRVVVTHEQKVAGILSTFDLLQLVEGKRFSMSNGPTPRRPKKLANRSESS